MPSIINATTTNGVAVSGDNSGSLALQTNNGTTALTIDTSQNVLVGQTSMPAGWGVTPRLSLKQSQTGAGAGVVVLSSSNDNTIYLGYDSSASLGKLGVSYGSTGSYTPLTVEVGGAERMRIDTSGNLQFNSGYGSVATAYGCRAWVNFNGSSTVAIRASGNVSSITDNGTGNYTVNLTNAMPDANYSVAGMASDTGGVGNRGLVALYKGVAAPTTSAFTIFTFTDSTQTDNTYVYVSVFR